jgi:adenosylcobinamide-phosphate synthase
MTTSLALGFIILFIALFLDAILGEPPDIIHPVVFIGMTISKFKPYFMKTGNRIIMGCLFLLSVIILNTAPLLITLYILYMTRNIILLILFIIVYAYFLKSTFSIKGMGTHIKRIINAMQMNDIESARKYTSMVVRRSTANMDYSHIASASIETIAEGFVDGYLTPMFFYAFFGIGGSMVAKIVNTMDSNIAYRDNEHYEFGRCTAIGDSITNFISSRMSPAIFGVSAFIIGVKYKKTKIINTTDSLNAGYSIGAMAEILGIKLEKSGEYIINANGSYPCINDIKKALNIYYISCIISVLIFVIPIMLILYVLHLNMLL